MSYRSCPCSPSDQLTLSVIDHLLNVPPRYLCSTFQKQLVTRLLTQGCEQLKVCQWHGLRTYYCLTPPAAPPDAVAVKAKPRTTHSSQS